MPIYSVSVGRGFAVTAAASSYQRTLTFRNHAQPDRRSECFLIIPDLVNCQLSASSLPTLRARREDMK